MALKTKRLNSPRPARFTKRCDAHFNEHEIKRERSGRQHEVAAVRRDSRADEARQDVRRYAAEQGLSDEVAVKRGLEEKAAEFIEKGSEVYAKT